MAKFDYNSYLGTLDEYNEPVEKFIDKKVKNNTEKMKSSNKVHKFKKNNNEY